MGWSLHSAQIAPRCSKIVRKPARLFAFAICAGEGWRLSNRGLPNPRTARAGPRPRANAGQERVPANPNAKDGTTIEVIGMENERSNRRRAAQSGWALSRFALSPA